MRIAILSDTHMPRGSRALPNACVERCRAADLILHAGDLIRLTVLRELEAIGPPVHAIHGNVDDEAVRDVLPARRTVALPGGVRIGMVHDAGSAAGRLARLRKAFPDHAAVVFGHSHLPLYQCDATDGFQIMNPGSPTERRRAPTHTMAEAILEAGELRFAIIDV
jgi:putative phosphoesterase